MDAIEHRLIGEERTNCTPGASNPYLSVVIRIQNNSFKPANALSHNANASNNF